MTDRAVRRQPIAHPIRSEQDLCSVSGEPSGIRPECRHAARTNKREPLVRAGGFDPVRADGVRDVGRIEVYGDPHASGGLDGRLLPVAEARVALDAV